MFCSDSEFGIKVTFFGIFHGFYSLIRKNKKGNTTFLTRQLASSPTRQLWNSQARQLASLLAFFPCDLFKNISS